MNKKSVQKSVPINSLPASDKMDAMVRAIRSLKKNSPSADSIRIGNTYLYHRGEK